MLLVVHNHSFMVNRDVFEGCEKAYADRKKVFSSVYGSDKKEDPGLGSRKDCSTKDPESGTIWGKGICNRTTGGTGTA